MGTIQIVTDVAGQVNYNPRRVKIISTDSLNTITTAGYLNAGNLEGYALYPTDIIDLIYSYNQVTQSGTYSVCTVSISNSVITLTAYVSAGDVTLPVSNNYIAVFDGTTGKIKQAAVGDAVLNLGSIVSGSSNGSSGGSITVLPPGPNKGFLNFNCVNNTGNTGITITNAVMGQASVFTIPDPATATANISVAPAALVGNNLIKASGTAGLVADSGIAVSAVQLSSNIKASLTQIGGHGTTPQTVSVAGMTASSIVVATTAVSSNAGVYVLSSTPGSGGFTVTPSGDPGASWIINYIALIVTQ